MFSSRFRAVAVVVVSLKVPFNDPLTAKAAKTSFISELVFLQTQLLSFPIVEFLWTVCRFRNKKKSSSSCVYAPTKNLALRISSFL